MVQDYYPNQATILRREVLSRIARAWLDDAPAETFDRIPYEVIPIGPAHYRCCTFKERQIVKFRCIAALGFSVECLEDPEKEIARHMRPIARYVEETRGRDQPVDTHILSVLDIACEGCSENQYVISDACRGCLARPCQVNCPKDCIDIRQRQARIDHDRCINCGKCKQVCPYHAILKIGVPCEESCPVDAIKKNQNGHSRIDFSKCIYCGRCMRACPFGAVAEKSQIIDVLAAIQSEKPVVAMCAPAIAGQFAASPEQIAAALEKMGFDQVREVAVGADATCRAEAEEFTEKVLEGDQPLMTTSCCSAYIEAVRKHVPELRSMVSRTGTPMHMIAEEVRGEMPEAVTVFLGPCVAKRREGRLDDSVDFVMTFEEVEALLQAMEISLTDGDPSPLSEPAHQQGRGFPLTGNVSGAVRSMCLRPEAVEPVLIDGLSHKGVAQLKKYSRGKCPGNLVEVMACEGGCINGAGVAMNPKKAARSVAKFAESSDPLPGSTPSEK